MHADGPPSVTRTWRAMGSEVSLVVVGDPAHAAAVVDLADAAVARIDELERRWSRFIESSEVSELNRRAGTPVLVSAETIELVATAVEAWRATAGAFDPLVGDAVIAAGYDRTIEAVQQGGPARLGPSHPSDGCEAVRIDDEAKTITIPAGTRFDPGGVGKGLAADLITAELLAAGAAGACVELGGDVRVAGRSPEQDQELGWTIGVADPFSPTDDTVVASIGDGAVATSSTLKRRWRTDAGDDAHHLIDPATGRPSTSEVVTATIIAATGATAEALATASIVAGVERATSMIEALGAAGMLTERSGACTLVGPFEAFLVQPFPIDQSVESPG